jgi:hypothetical protein
LPTQQSATCPAFRFLVPANVVGPVYEQSKGTKALLA